MHIITRIFILSFALQVFPAAQSHAESIVPTPAISCTATDTDCLAKMLETQASLISDQRWRDQTFRETAKILTHIGKTGEAIALIQKIENPDTKAMTIRGIGMAAAAEKLDKESYDDLFAKLANESKKIEHPPSFAIAQTYIAMAQAFAGDNEGALKTANAMENEALRNKAHGEAAEIQAERGELDAVMQSLDAIKSLSFRNKALRTVSKIFADRAMYEKSLKTAMRIEENDYLKSQALLYILVKQVTPEEANVE